MKKVKEEGRREGIFVDWSTGTSDGGDFYEEERHGGDLLKWKIVRKGRVVVASRGLVRKPWKKSRKVRKKEKEYSWISHGSHIRAACDFAT